MDRNTRKQRLLCRIFLLNVFKQDALANMRIRNGPLTIIDKDAEGNWQFSTSKEAEYPNPLAKAIALSFIDRLLKIKSINLLDDLADHAAKVTTYLQPRRTRGPVSLSEFKTKAQISCNPDAEVPKTIPIDAEFPWQGIPIGSKLLETQPVHDENGELVRLVATFGVYYSEKEFLQKALEIERSFDTPLPGRVKS